MTHKQSIPTSFDATIGAHDACIEFDRVTVFSHDAHYGADADGNRGVPMNFIDDDYAEDIMVLTWEGSDGAREVATPIDALTSLQALEVQRLIDDYLEQHDPAYKEPEDDPDRGRDDDFDRACDDEDRRGEW